MIFAQSCSQCCLAQVCFVLHNEAIIPPYNLLSQYFDMGVARLLKQPNHGRPRAVYYVVATCRGTPILYSKARELINYLYRPHQLLDLFTCLHFRRRQSTYVSNLLLKEAVTIF
jgi:hypothetical protein